MLGNDYNRIIIIFNVSKSPEVIRQPGCFFKYPVVKKNTYVLIINRLAAGSIPR